jgi:methylase of polypeptide subunit release factors
MFPDGSFDVIACNPPWIPLDDANGGEALSGLEATVYDPNSRMLRAYIAGLKQHLNKGGQGWLVLSDLAEHLGVTQLVKQLVS